MVVLKMYKLLCVSLHGMGLSYFYVLDSRGLYKNLWGLWAMEW